MTGGEAFTYIQDHDRRVRDLNHMRVGELKDIHAEALTTAGQQLLLGGPVSKDELINGILELEFPSMSEARRVYFEATG